MKRLLAAAAVAFAALAAGVLAWLWWTAAPAAAEAELAAALATAPAVEGRLAIAQPRRAARWLARHPQAIVLPALAAANARAALPRLQPLLRPLVTGADGPLVLWWQGGDLAAAARLPAGTTRAVQLIAAGADLAFSSGDGLTVAAASPELLVGSGGAAPATSGFTLAALAVVGGAEWRATAERDALSVWTGASTSAPAAGSGSRVDSADARRLAALLGLDAGSEPLPLRLLLAPGGAWAAALPARVVPRFVRDGISRVAGAGAPPVRWAGLFGELWVQGGGDRLLLAADEAALAAAAAAPVADEGVLLGSDVVAVTSRLAGEIENVPLLGREARQLRAAAEFARGLAGARWRSTAAGTRIELSW